MSGAKDSAVTPELGKTGFVRNRGRREGATREEVWLLPATMADATRWAANGGGSG